MKKIVRQETEEDFFARMTSLAQKLDRREPVETSDSISFEDHDEMKAFQAAQEKEERKTPLTLIAGGGKGKPKAKDLHSSLTVFRKFKNARWQNASVTFERDAKKIVRSYTAKVDLSAAGLIVITALRSEADRAPLILREK